MKRSCGFTLIEMAVVVVIIAALLTLGLGALNAQLSSASYATTKQRQVAIKDALIAYLGSNKRLPCPYVPTAGSAITGIAPNQSGTPPVCPSFGIVPFATLGVAREVAQDGWGNFFSYQVFAQATPTCPGVAIDWGNSNCFGAGKNGGISVLDNTGGNNLPLTTNAVVAIISQGANGLGAWAAQASQNAPPVTCEERTNANLSGGCPTPAGITPPYYFKGERQDQDDVVAWIDATEAINALSKQGVLKTAIAQVNDDLQAIYDNKLGTKLSHITGAPPGPPGGCSYDVLTTTRPAYDQWGYQYAVTGNTGPTSTSPLSVCSLGCPTCGCKTIDINTFNGYLAKQGYSPQCP
jgi:prepilin-type N-terminal cleavage/methylation domain-containing protein